MERLSGTLTTLQSDILPPPSEVAEVGGLSVLKRFAA